MNKRIKKLPRREIMRGIAVFCSIVAIFLSSVTALADTGEPGHAHWPHYQSDLEPSPGIIFGTLDNGIRYILKENEKPADRVSMHLNIEAGSFHEQDHERGIAHFLEHMLFMGSENFEPGELVKYFQRIGMRFGPDVNARTGFFQTIYDIDLPEASEENLSEALLVLHDYAAGGLIPEEEVDRERPVILAEKRTRDSPSYRTFEETLAFEMPGTRLIERLPIGTREVLISANRDLIKTFYDTWYRPENIIIVMVGNFDAKITEKLLRERFADITPRTAKERPLPEFGEFKHEGVKPFYHHEPESGGTRVEIEVIERKDQPADSLDYRKKRLLELMANQIVNHRLDNVLNSPNAPFTSASISSSYYFGYVRAAEISAQCAPEQWGETLGVLEQNLRKALLYGFTESETNRVKSEFTAQLERAARAAPTRESAGIARQFLNDLSQNRVLLLDAENLALFKPMIDEATTESLHSAFKTAWSPDHRLVLVTGSADLTQEGKTPEDQIISIYEKSREQEVEKPAETESISFPYLERPGTPGSIRTREKIDDLDITRVVFENGTTLFVKKTNFKTDEVLASLRFGHGRRSETEENDGLAQMSQRVVNLSGLGAMDREQLRNALAGTSTNVSFAVEEDAFSFSGQSVTQETGLLFELLYAHIKDTGFREEAHALAIRQFERQYETLVHSIEGAFQLKGGRFLAGGDTRFGMPDFDTLAGNELKDIRKWIEDAKKTSPMEVIVVGDIDPEAVIQMAAIFFGTLPPPGKSRIENDREPSFPKGDRLEHKVPTRMERALLLVAYPTTDMHNIEKARRLSILSDIFSDRMRIRVRDELGATYSQGSHSTPSRTYKGYGLFNALASIAPEDAGKIEAEIKKIAETLKKSGVTEDELERAVNPVLASITSQVRTNTYWLSTVLKGASRRPAQIDWSRTIYSDHASITVADVNRMAQEYLDNEAAATLLFSPADTPKEESSVSPAQEEN